MFVTDYEFSWIQIGWFEPIRKTRNQGYRKLVLQIIVCFGSRMGVGGLLRAQRRPRVCYHFMGHFYVAFSKEICVMPLQMPHYSYDEQV